MERRLYRTASTVAFLALAGLLLGTTGDGTDSGDQADATNPTPNPTRGAYERFAVASDHPLASNAGLEVLRAGGNAADAAAATMLALGVVNPQSSGMGGGGFAVYYDAESGTTTFLDFREAAPAAATPDMFANNERSEELGGRPSQVGGLASGVPGEPAGIAQLVERFGDKPLSIAAAPAARLAREGFDAHEPLSRASAYTVDALRRDPTMRRWILPGADRVAVGQRIRRPQLARTLTAFGRGGHAAIYSGRIAREIVRANNRNGGNMTMEDLESYQVIEREPLSVDALGFHWVTAPPPSAGGYTMLASLALLDQWIPEARRADGGASLFHALAESWKGPFWDRASYFGDPTFVDVPTAALLETERIDRRAAIYRRQVATPADLYAMPLPNRPAAPLTPPEEHGTSHLSVVDEEGNVAAITTTVNLYFGARYTAAGMVMNDEMDDFASAVGVANAFGLPGGAPNLPGPGHRPVSSMTPTIVFDAEGPVLAIGASGGSRIVTATEQVAWHTLVRGLDPFDALNHPRVHHQGYPNVLRTEETNPQPGGVLEGLGTRGHPRETARHSAVVQLIRIMRGEGPRLIAVSDPRKGGRPAGE